MPKVTKQDVQKMIGKVPAENVFRCYDGRVLTDMPELADALNTMTDEIFVYHANQTRNDFTNWVRDIIKDEKLASDLLRANNKKLAAKMVEERIMSLKRIHK